MDTRENFCGACLTIPLAFAGAGTAFGAKQTVQLKKWAIIFTLVSIVVTFYFIYVRKCKSCKIG